MNVNNLNNGIVAGDALVEVITENEILKKVDFCNIKAASVDVRLGNTILREAWCDNYGEVDLTTKGDDVKFDEIDITDGVWIEPNEFFLASTIEEWNLPDCISTDFKLRSSIARRGLNHMLACWADAGFFGANLTLELKNELENHRLFIKAGMPIGQVVVNKHDEVPEHMSYRNKGRYNGVKGTVNSKGI